MKDMEVEDTYAEVFPGYYSEVLITAKNRKWLMESVRAITGCATSIIGCRCEAGLDRILPREKTPDKRVGALVQFWIPTFRKNPLKELEKELVRRIGQCVLTAPTTAVWNYTKSRKKFPVGKKLGFFGDGFQEEMKVYGREIVVIPRMMGKFLIEKEMGYGKGVMGGNLWFFCSSENSALKAAELAVNSIRKVEGAIVPFAGGICASGSKVGSRYSFLSASTNSRLCPTLREKIKNSEIPEGVNSVSEVIIDGISKKVVEKAMKFGIRAAKGVRGLVKISAGRYDEKLGKGRIYLKR